MNQNIPSEIPSDPNAIAILTELIKRQQLGYRSPELIEHEQRLARIGAALKPETRLPPADDVAEKYMTIVLKRCDPYAAKRHPDMFYATLVGCTLEDADTGEFCVFDITPGLPVFLESRFLKAGWPRELGELERLQRAGLLTMRPGVEITDPDIARALGVSIGADLLLDKKIDSEAVLRVARICQGHGLEDMSRALRAALNGVRSQAISEVFEIQGGFGDD